MLVINAVTGMPETFARLRWWHVEMIIYIS